MFTNVNGEIECPACGFSGGASEFGAASWADDGDEMICPNCGEESPLESVDDDEL